MAIRKIMTIGLCGVICTMSASASAQDAAESATILSGQGGTAKAQKSLGTAVSGSLDNASAAIRPRVSRRSNSRRARRSNSSGGITLSTNDPLEGTDAATYQTGNGTTIRVSGRLNPSSTTACVNNCTSDNPDE